MKKITLLLLIPFFSYGQWTQVGDDIDGEFSGDQSGRATCINSDGSIVAVGATQNSNAAGQVRVYENISGAWAQIGDDIIGESNAFNSGHSLSINDAGTIIATGAQLYGYSDSTISTGHVRVYEYISGNWIQKGDDIIGDSVGDQMGQSVSLNGIGNIVAVGASYNYNGLTNTGYIKIFEYINDDWVQIGETIYGEYAGDLAQSSICLNNDGTIIAIGASLNDGSGWDAGSVRVYKNISGVWTQIGDDIDGETDGDNSGASVSLNNAGNIVAIGAPFNDGNGETSGHVRVYENISGVWTQIGGDIDGEAEIDHSGESVSLNAEGNILAVGASTNDGGGFNSGHVRVYKNNFGQWQQVDSDIDGEAERDGSGISVSLNDSGNTVAIGAWQNDGANGEGSGHVRVYNNALLSVEDIALQNSQLTMYPNPSRGITKIALGKRYTTASISIYNMLGKLITTKTYTNTNNITFNTETFHSGTYIVKVSTQTKETNLKLVVR